MLCVYVFELWNTHIEFQAFFQESVVKRKEYYFFFYIESLI